MAKRNLSAKREYNFKRLNDAHGNRLDATTMALRVAGQYVVCRAFEGEILFPVSGNISVIGTEGNYGWLGVGSEVTVTDDNALKTIILKFTVTANNIVIEIDVTYKTAQKIVTEGLVGKITETINLTRDGNIHVEGEAVTVGGDGDTFKILTDDGSVHYHMIIRPGPVRTYFREQDRTVSENRNCKVTISESIDPVRTLCQPNGHNATYTTVIHADGQLRESLETVIYGSSDSAHADHGVKGMFPRGIKGTWSTFADSEDSVYAHYEGVDDTDMLNLLLQMQIDGYEIIPHSLYDGINRNESRADALTELPILNTHFSCRNWTDHGLGSGPTTIGMASYGWDESATDHYIMDLFETYGYEYAHGYEDSNMTNRNQILEERYGFPFEILFQNPNVKMPTAGMLWFYRNSNRAMQYLVQAVDHEAIVNEWITQCGVITDHDYIGWLGRDGENFVSGTPYLTTAKFDSVCQYIGAKIAAGELWNPTHSEFCDYFRKLLNVKVSIGDSQFTVNNSGATVNGCSFLIGGATVTPAVGGTPINSKHVTRGTICWLDLPNGSTTVTY